MDPDTRKKYNEFGASAGKGGADEVVDPEAVFSSLFGGEKFQDIIGTISLGQEMKAAMQEEPEEEDDDDEEPEAGTSSGSQVGQVGQNQGSVTQDGKKKKKKELSPEAKARKAELEKKQNEEREKARAERVAKLTASLTKKLGIYTEQLKHGGSRQEVSQSGRTRSRFISAQRIDCKYDSQRGLSGPSKRTSSKTSLTGLICSM